MDTEVIENIVTNYRAHLSSSSNKLLHLFDHRLRGEPHAARAEAVAYHVLQVLGAQPRIFEDPDHGGPDLTCTGEGQEYLLEVTSIDSEVVTCSV